MALYSSYSSSLLHSHSAGTLPHFGQVVQPQVSHIFLDENYFSSKFFSTFDFRFSKLFEYYHPRFRRRELRTTESEEKAMAAAAKIGLSKIPKKG